MLTLTREIPWKNVNDIKHPDGDKAAVSVEIQTAETLEEAVNDAGGEEKLVEAYNDAKVNRALTNGRNVIRNAKVGQAINDIIDKARQAVKLFSFATAGDRIGVKQKAENATSALDYLKSLSPEDLASLDANALREKVLAELMKR